MVDSICQQFDMLQKIEPFNKINWTFSTFANAVSVLCFKSF